MIYRIAIASGLRRLFDYLPVADSVQTLRPGSRVKVPFGNRTLIGLVIEETTDTEVDSGKLKAISEVVDREPCLDNDLLALAQWASRYYQFPLGDTLLGILPTLLRKGEPLLAQQEYWRLTTRGLGLPETALARAKKQQALLNLLQQQSPCPISALKTAGFDRSHLRTLEKKGLVEVCWLDAEMQASDEGCLEDLLAEPPLTLGLEQRQAMDAIDYHGFAPYLLQGETGSGKTEVYLHAIANVLRYGRQAMVLIPEINLTPQTLKRFQNRFRCNLAVLHSGLTDRERLDAWRRARSGEAKIIIGTRSAVFTPMAKPGIIIVDEEHDSSYKQQDGFRYSARDVAVMRANRAGIPIILGSATPSLESLHNCQLKRYRHLLITERAAGASPPQWQLVDIRHSQLQGGISQPALKAISQTLQQGHQVLVFLNRRGYAPLFMCHDCGWSARCLGCDRPMTTHLGKRQLLCHHCENHYPLPHRCPTCHSKVLEFIGQGTERCEESIASFFPDTPVMRIDSDTTSSKQAMAKLVDVINEGEPAILIGTQMLAKGHHFPAVALTVILDVDGGLFGADFRATERMGQLITQVAGRTGRGSVAGTVLLQSHHCDHPLIQQLVTQSYSDFAATLMAERQLAQTPPFSSLALIRAESRDIEQAQVLLAEARHLCEQLAPPRPELRYLGPLPCGHEKRMDRYRFQLAIYSNSRPQLQQLLEQLCLHLEKDKLARRLRWSVDVDPQDML